MDLVNLPLIRYLASTMKPVILSTGMSNMGQIEEAVEAVCETGNPNLMLLHCNSSYPAAPAEMNLRAIETMRQAFRVPVGLSDHTFGLLASTIAIARGASVIER
ncbi:N-acetylneuraminate synthase family protein, partial [Klebsiella pneumoniae]